MIRCKVLALFGLWISANRCYRSILSLVKWFCIKHNMAKLSSLHVIMTLGKA
jgi:hypothetical protein